MDFLVYLEQSRFSTWVRESGSLVAFPSILLLHTYGMAILVGIVAAMDVRILGFAPAFPLSAIKEFFPMLWAAFWVNAATGTILLVADATTKTDEPRVFCQDGVHRACRRRPAKDPEPRAS